MTKEQIFKHDYSFELQRIAKGERRKAKGDLLSAEGMLESKKGRPENVCYMAQQAIEKSLKALLCYLNKPVPFTHSIELILDRLPRDLRPAGGEALIALTDFAMIRRYNEGNEVISTEDMKATVEAASAVLKWVGLQLK